jgi:hypothetical protein
MHVELTPAECDLLLQLVDSALREIGPEIHHTMTSSYKDDLREQRRELRHLQAVLAAASAGMPLPTPASADSSDAVGLA